MFKRKPKTQLLVISRWRKPYQTLTIYQEIVKIDGKFAIWSVAHKKELGNRRDNAEQLEKSLKNIGYREVVL